MSSVSSDDIVITEQYGSDLVITFANTGDTIVFTGYKWNQGALTIEFADGILATVNKDTFELELLNQIESDSESSYENQNNEESVGEATPIDADVDDTSTTMELEESINDTETSYEEQYNYDDLDVSTYTDATVVD